MSTDNNKQKIQIAVAALVLLVLLFLLVRNAASNESSVSVENGTAMLTETEHLNDSKRLLAEKTERIKELKAAGLADDATIAQLEGEVQTLQDSITVIQGALDDAVSASEYQQLKQRTIEITRRTNELGEKADRTITRSAGEKVRTIQQNLEKIDAKYAQELAEKNRKIKALEMEREKAQYSPKSAERIAELEARIKELEAEVSKWKREAEIWRKKFDSSELASLRNSGQTQRAAELEEKLRQRDDTIAVLDQRLQAAQNIIKKIGGLEVYFIDNQGRKITTDKASKARDLHALRINFAEVGAVDGDVEIKIRKGSPEGEEIKELTGDGTIKNCVLSPHVDIEGERRKLLPKGKYYVTIAYSGSKMPLAHRVFEVHNSW